MEALLDRLCGLFDDELERQQNVLAICIAQGQAARAHHVDALQARSSALALSVQEALNAEKQRLGLLRQIVDQYALPLERQTLTGLIETVPEPWKTRMQEFQTRLRTTLEETRKVVRENNRIMRSSLTIVNDAFDAVIQRRTIPRGHYDERGEETPGNRAQPAVIDQRG